MTAELPAHFNVDLGTADHDDTWGGDTIGVAPFTLQLSLLHYDFPHHSFNISWVS